MGVLVGFLLAGVVFYVSRLPSGETIALLPAPTVAPIAVDVTGAVVRPGMYKFPEGSRVQDAIDAAGGLLADAETSALNLAARLEDAQQLEIPYKEGTAPAATEAPVFSYSAPDETDSESDSETELIDINTATLEQLDTLPGIGPTTAQKIIDYRTANGPFVSVEDLMYVSGIGPSTLDNVRDQITVGE